MMIPNFQPKISFINISKSQEKLILLFFFFFGFEIKFVEKHTFIIFPLVFNESLVILGFAVLSYLKRAYIVPSVPFHYFAVGAVQLKFCRKFSNIVTKFKLFSSFTRLLCFFVSDINSKPFNFNYNSSVKVTKNLFYNTL